MTDEERFQFDLTGFLVRPAILTADEVAAAVDHVDRLIHDHESLPPEHRAAVAGPTSSLVDHPRVVEVLHELIGPDVRLEGAFAVWRHRGEAEGQPLHRGGELQADPIFGYRVERGRIFAGMVRVVFELTDVTSEDGATRFLAGSHKANFPIPDTLTRVTPNDRSDPLVGYDCPAGSAIFFTENLAHVGPVWQRDTPRVAILNAYAHLATRFHRPTFPPEVVADLSPERRAYLREPWMLDFRQRPTARNTVEHFIEEQAAGHR